jgi:osmotically-inducible protein OsmY
MRALVKASREAVPVPAGEIRDKLISELEKQPWAPTAFIDISVQDGVVTLSGSITDERQRQALRVAAESISGVKGVVDELALIEPAAGLVA